MLFTLRSTSLFSASIAASPLAFGPVTVVPAGAERADPVVTPARDPDELAVPALLVPGGGGELSLEALPTPLGSLPELFSPPAFAGPEGTPLTPAVPAPAEPALGEPTALLLPAEGPLAAPPALPPPALAPPPLPPPPLCANKPMGEIRIAKTATEATAFALVIGKLPLEFNDAGVPRVPDEFVRPITHWSRDIQAPEAAAVPT